MKHITITFITIVAISTIACTSQTKQYVPDASISMDYSQEPEDKVIPASESKQSESGKANPQKDNRTCYQIGYDEGYDNGMEDGVMDLGDGYSYNDSNPFSGSDAIEYARGYRKGYKDGYEEGFYNSSEGDEEMYDEWM